MGTENLIGNVAARGMDVVNTGGTPVLQRGVKGREGAAVALAAALTAVALVEPALAGKNVQVDKVVKGSATFQRNGGVLNIRAGDRTIINYKRFDVANGETVRFIQPSASSRVLNRINSATPSRIDGTIKGNGIVYFVNPAGVMFGANSVINVGQFYAAAGNITDANFLNNVNQFRATGALVNEGVINSQAVALIGRTVANSGTIAAEGGLVTMVAGEDVMLGTRDGHIMVKLAPADAAAATGSPKGGVTNTGTVRAGSTVLAAGDLYSLAIGGSVKSREVNARAGGDVAVTGKIDASGVRGGNVVVTGKNVELKGATIDASGRDGGGKVLVGGDYQGKGDLPRAVTTVIDNGTTITASATGKGDGGKVVVWADGKTTYNGSISAKGGADGGNGGLVEVSGKGTLDFNGVVDTTAAKGKMGTLLLDPATLTIAASNPDVHGDGSNQDIDSVGNVAAGDDPGANSVITSTKLVQQLNGNNVSLAATDSITVATPVDASGNPLGGNLTLEAGTINVNSPIHLNNSDITLNGGASVVLGANINTHGGDAFINVSAGNVQGGVGRVTADHLTIEAATGIGAVQPVLTALTGGLEAHAAVGDIVISNNTPTLNLGFAGGTKGGVQADAGLITITQLNGNIRVAAANQTVSASGAVSLTSIGGSVITDNYVGAPGGGQVESTAGAVLLVSTAGDIMLGQTSKGDVRAFSGVTITAATGNVFIDNATFVESDGGAINVTAGTEVALRQTSLDQAHLWNNGAGGTIAINAPTFSAASGATPASVSADGNVTITADDVSFGDRIVSQNGAVQFTTRTAGRGISLADAPVGGNLTLTSTMLDLVDAEVVRIGGTAGSNISVAGTITQGLGWDTLHLTGPTVSDAAGGTLQVTNLAVETTDGTTLNNQSHVIGTLAANNTATGGVAVKGLGDLAIGTVAGVAGVTAGGAGTAEIETSGTLSVSTIGAGVQGVDGVSLAAGVDVVINADANSVVSSAGAISIDADRDVVIGLGGIFGDVDAATGLTISAGRHVFFDETSVADTAAGNVSVVGGTSIQFLATTNPGAQLANDGAGNISLSAPTIIVQSGAAPATIRTAGGDILISTDDLTLTDAIDAGAGAIAISGFDVNRTIRLGGAPVGGTLTLTNAQLSLLNAAVVRIGGTYDGDIQIAGPITQPLGWTALSLQTTGTISDAAGGMLQVQNVAARGGTVDLSNQAHFIETFAGGGGAVTVRSDASQTLKIGTVDGVVGIATTGNTTLIADAVDIADVINAGAGIVTIQNQTAGRTIDMGSASDAGVLGLSVTELNRVTAAVLRVGSATAGAITVSDVDSASAGWNTLHLTSGAGISKTGGMAVGALALTAGGNIDLAGADVEVQTVAATTTGTFNFRSATNLAVGTVDGVVGVTANGLTRIGSDLVLTLTQDVNAAGQTVVLTGTNGITQSGGAITADALAFRSSAGEVVLGSNTNNVLTVAGEGQLGASFTDGSGGFTVGTVDGVNGIATHGDVVLTALAGGDISVVQKIDTDGGDLTATAGHDFTVSGSGAIDTRGSGNGAAGGAVDISASMVNGTVNIAGTVLTHGLDGAAADGGDGGDVEIQGNTVILAGGINAKGGAATGAGKVGGDGGEITVTTGTGDLTLGGDVNAAGGVGTGGNGVGGDVDLTGVSIVLSNDIVVRGGETISFSGNVRGNTNGGESLTVVGASSGTVSFDSPIGDGGKALESLTVTAAAAEILGGTVTTTGAQTYAAVILGNNTTLNATGVTFNGTVDGDASGPWNLTIHNTGVATFGAAVGAGGKVGVLVVDGAAAINGGSVKTTGAQKYSGAVTLGADATVTGTAITFGSTVRAASNGGQALTVSNSGPVTFDGAVGDSGKALSSLAVTGAAVMNGGSVVTTGAQSYGGAVMLKKNTALVGSAMTFASTVNGETAGAYSLSLANTGVATFGAAVGGTGALASLVVNGAAAMNGGTVSTTGLQTYSGAVTLGVDTLLSGGAMTFGSTVNGVTDGGQSLVLNNTAVATFGGAVGGVQRLELLTVAGKAAINGSGVNTAGAQAYAGAVTVGGNTTVTGTTITFASTVDDSAAGQHSLTLVNSGLAAFGGAVGGTAKLRALTVGGPAMFSAGSVRTSGKQVYGGAVTVSQNVTFDAGDDVSFGKTLDGGVAVQVNTGSGTAIFAGNVGGSTALKGLSTSGKTKIGKAGETTVVSVADVDNGEDADISIGGDLRVAGNVKLQVVSGARNGILLGGDVDGTTAGADRLTVLVPWSENAEGSLALPLITFASPNVGTRTQLRSLRLNAEGADAAGGINGDVGAPAVATVFALQGLDVRVTDDFTMGRNEKLTAGSGDVIVKAGKTATIGDINTPGNLSVTAPKIVLQQRAPGALYVKSTGTVITDTGLNFVSGGDMAFSGTFVETDSDHALVNFTSGGSGPGGVVNQLSNGVIRAVTTPLTDADMVAEVTVDGQSVTVPLDFGTAGGSIVNPATVFANGTEIPQTYANGPSTLSPAKLALLEEIGVHTRAMTSDELVTGLDGHTLYVQANEPTLTVAEARLDDEVLRDVIDTYATLFVADGDAPSTDRQAAKADAKAHMTAAYEAYAKANPGPDFDGPAFRQYLQVTTEHKAALDQMNRLRTFLAQLELLGLTPKEIADAKARVCGEVKPDALKVNDFVEAILAPTPNTELALDVE